MTGSGACDVTGAATEEGAVGGVEAWHPDDLQPARITATAEKRSEVRRFMRWDTPGGGGAVTSDSITGGARMVDSAPGDGDDAVGRNAMDLS